MAIRIRFHVTIAVTIVAIVVALAATTLGSVYLASTRAARETAGQLFDTAAERVHERIDELMGRALRLANLGAAQAGLASIGPQGTDSPALPFVFAALDEDTSLYSLYWGLDDGSFLQVIAARGDERIVAAHSAPAGTVWIVRAITGTGPTRTQRWLFLDSGRAALGNATDPQPAYDPRQRPWYGAAKDAEAAQLSAAYMFNSLKQPGITASKRFEGGTFGVDIALEGLDRFVEEQKVSANGGLIVVDADRRALAATHALAPGLAPLTDIRAVDLPALKAAAAALGRGAEETITEVEGGLLLHLTVRKVGGRDVAIAVAAPAADFAAHIREMQGQIGIIALACLVLLLPAALLLSDRIAARVRALAAEAMRVREMDFSGGPPQRSRIVEFDELGQAFWTMKKTLSARTQALEVAQEKLSTLIDLGIAMAVERDGSRLMEMVLLGAKDLANADGGSLYVRGDDERLHFQIVRNDTLGVMLGGATGAPISFPPVPMYGEDGTPNHRNVVSHAVHEHVTVNIADAYRSSEFDFSGTRAFDERTGYRSTSFITVPLKPRGGEVIGALQLINARPPGSAAVVPFAPEIQRFVEALAAQAATALYNRDLLSAQERLMEAMIQLIAGAIDAKSPYTGGHCNRVPELAQMLALEASLQSEGPFADFALTTEEEWREFRIGAWLHDCGKVITPEHVVDKATKLETIYNRIHEVRMRFEVLLRDAEIARLEAVAANADEKAARDAFAARKAQLLDDFAFVAECNLGGEFMAPEKVERLKTIAATTWIRHFDDRLGLAHDELKRHQGSPAEGLPCAEALLADKPWHKIPREDVADPYAELGFKVKVPEYLYDQGELHNLAVGRGTLSDEDRFKINEHIMQTIAMLERLPFPKNLRRVPEYAGTHHETLTGSGYPRRLAGEALSIPARIMAIADIFEALTASDRPYKKAKPLSEAIKILAMFKAEGHIDPDLFNLFLKSGVYRRYAERFLAPGQIDEVDIGTYVGA